MKQSISKLVYASISVALLLGCFVAIVEAKPGKAYWTFMIYLDADNNLDPYGPLNLEQISHGLAANAKVNVIVLMDRLNMPAYIYKVSYRSIEVVEYVGEVDMGSPQTLLMVYYILNEKL